MNDVLTNLSIVAPAFLAGLLILASHVPLGREVLKRGIIFLDIAIAQIAAFGIMLTAFLELENNPILAESIAIGSALAGAWFLQYTEKRFPDVQEAIIGSVFVLTATGSILLLAGNPHSSEHLKELLSGQILWVSNSKLLLLVLFSLGVALLWWRFPSAMRQRWFYPLFAVAITASVQVVGVYLVFSSLILPALAVYGIRTHAIKVAFLLGSSSYFIGLIISTLFDLPAGPLIVWSLAGHSLLFLAWRKVAKRA